MSRFALTLVLLVTPILAIPVSRYQQCGGKDFHGSSECEEGSECAPLHVCWLEGFAPIARTDSRTQPYYWQCIPSPIMSDALAAALQGSQQNRPATVTMAYAEGALAAPGPDVDTLIPIRTIMPQMPFSGRAKLPEPTQG